MSPSELPIVPQAFACEELFVNPYHIGGLPQLLVEEVRGTRLSPGYGHPVVSETAQGTGPCRSCLDLFEVGREERLLFTYGPPSGSDTLAAPGPVYIHAGDCTRYDAAQFPDTLRELPLIIEGRTGNGRILRSVPITGNQIDKVLDDLLADLEVDFLFLRHGEAGCHIARIDRAVA